MFQDYHRWVRQYDTNGQRPLYEVTYNDTESPALLTNVDILTVENYPVGQGLRSHASIRYTVQQSAIGSIINAGCTVGSNYLTGQKTPMIDLYCSNENGYTNLPTPVQCYHDFWSAIASGAQGIVVYGYWNVFHNGTPSLTNNLAAYNLAASQISGSDLGQAVLFGNQNTNVNFTVTSGPTNTETFAMGSSNWMYPSINVLCKTWSSNVYVIAVNSTSNSVTADITNLPVASAMGALPFELRSVAVANGGFADTFAPWGVHIYKINTYALTYAAGANGTISGNSAQTVGGGGNGSVITAVANTGYHFVNWSDGSAANPRTDVNVISNVTVTANFAINSYALAYTAGANGTISGGSPQTVNYGASGSAVTAVANTGYNFVNWSDGSTANPRTDLNVTSNLAVTANFAINTYTLAYAAGMNGTISGSSPQTVNYGASGSAITAMANTGYHFVNWSDGSAANPRTDLNVTSNITVTANFAANTYTMGYSAGTNGTISGSSPQTVNYGTSGSAVTAVANTGYHFVNWSDGGTADPRTDVNVTNNITVTANFAINTYTLAYTAGTNGTISGSSPQTVNYGGSGSAVTAVANTNYHFVNWSDGSTANPRTDVNVTNNLMVTANFASGLLVPWTTNVIGSVSAAVTANYSGKTFTVAGAGAGLWGKSDNFWFVNMLVTNSFTITALVTSQQTNGGGPLAGVMIRQDTNANSLFAFMGLTPTNQAKWISRTSSHGNVSTTTFANPPAPYWVRIVRNTNTFTGYVSGDGVTWTQTVSLSLTMNSNVLAGLVVSSGASGTLNTAVFDNVTLTNNSGGSLFHSNSLLQASAQMKSFNVGAGTADFTIVGANDTLWELQESSDMITWTTLDTINLIGGSVDHAQGDDARPVRFFRLVLAP
jgi:regulation of enolase protein 1 (concanavalin A-like superfamily)